MRKPALNFIYVHSEKIGYGNHGLETHAALERLGVDVYDGLPGSGDADIEQKDAKICKDALFLTVPSHVKGWWEGQRKHLFTMWETDTLPEAMRDSLHNFDTILVPSKACLDMYSKYHNNVRYVPLGVNADRWHYQERKKPGVFFTFLTGGTGSRKGGDLVFRAFNELFPNGEPPSRDMPIPRLIFKSPRDDGYRGENIESVVGFITPEAEVDLYASAHCYVQPSRGEGWGLQPLQALAQGCPTILTDAHGHEPFARYGIPIAATKVPAAGMELFGECGDWWEPDYEALKKAMWDVYTNYETFHQPYAALQSDVVRNIFTWDASAQAILDVLDTDLLTERWTHPCLPMRFIEPERKLFRVITNKNWRADIGGTVNLFEKGATYWVPADTKRVLFEIKVLDPICLDDDKGLAPSQLARLGDYVRDSTICPLCGHSEDEREEVSA
jgi:glycosyltransferase involved in cell wall biosynthesis